MHPRSDPEDSPRKFTLETTHAICFIPNEDQGEATPANAGTYEDFKYWSSDITAPRWHCKWTAKGLAPIKVAIHLTKDLSLVGGQAVLLTTEG